MARSLLFMLCLGLVFPMASASGCTVHDGLELCPLDADHPVGVKPGSVPVVRSVVAAVDETGVDVHVALTPVDELSRLNWDGTKNEWLLEGVEQKEDPLEPVLHDRSWLLDPEPHSSAPPAVGRGQGAAVAPGSFAGEAGLRAAGPRMQWVTHAAGVDDTKDLQPSSEPGGPGQEAVFDRRLQEAHAPSANNEDVVAAALALPLVLSVIWLVGQEARWGAKLFTRVAEGRALSHARRAQAMEILAEAPGICVKDLADRLGVSISTANHHIRILEQTGHVTTQRSGRIRQVFAAQEGSLERRAAAVLRHEKAQLILEEVQRLPGIRQGELAETVGIRQSLAHWHLVRMEEAGLVRSSKQGRVRVYRPGGTFPSALI